MLEFEFKIAQQQQCIQSMVFVIFKIMLQCLFLDDLIMHCYNSRSVSLNNTDHIDRGIEH